MFAQSPPHLNKNIKILVVEDEKIIALNLKESLESLGYSVPAIAASGETAIAKAKEFVPNLVLMDIWLKGEMDGIEAAQKIWNDLKIPTIYVTGHSDQTTVERAKITAPFGYILKPIKEQALYVAIETALQRYEREQLLSAILSGIGDGVIVTDKDCRVQFMNQVAISLTGWQLAEARDRELSEVFNIVDEQTETPMGNILTRVLAEDKIIYLEEEILLIPKQGKPIPVADSIAPIKNNQGIIAGTVLVFRDASQQRLAEEKIRAMERVRQLDYDLAELQCLDILQEDNLNTMLCQLPMSPAKIKLAVRILETILNQQSLFSLPTPEDATVMTRYWQVVQEQCNQKLNLVNNLLDIRAIECQVYPLQLNSIQWVDWIPELIAPFEPWAKFQQQRFLVKLAPDLPALVSEISSLTRILTELLNNAFSYTPPGEEIGLIVADLRGEDRAVSPDGLSQHVQIQVSNSGVEIPWNERGKIFEPFYRLAHLYPWKQRGTGLGLTMVKRLVHRLRGEIHLTSNCNGTIFTIFLPSLQSLRMEVEHDQ